MKATTKVAQTTYKTLFIAGEFRVYRITAGKSFQSGSKEVFASESYDEAMDYVRVKR